MAEKELEAALVERLRHHELAAIKIVASTSDAKNFQDLCGQLSYNVIVDDSRWNTQPSFMADIIGGMTPDIVLRSVSTGQNRIYIEVKDSSELRYDIADSQAVRYFLHLLASSEMRPSGKDDIRRAFLVAAPSSWFSTKKNSDAWSYFVNRYSDLARVFNITLGEIHLSLA